MVYPGAAFTAEAANKALDVLRSQVNNRWNGEDFILVENELKMIKGYLFRAYLEGYRRSFGEDDKLLKDEFCKFLREEGFVSH